MRKGYIFLYLCLLLISCQNNSIVIDTSVVDSYLAGDDIIASVPSEYGTKEIVSHTFSVLKSALDEYRPYNCGALDSLFPGWRVVPINVSLSVGCSSETMINHNPPSIVFDVYLLSCYVIDDQTLKEGVWNLVSHESVSIIMENQGFGNGETLDDIAFREGFASLLSFAGHEINEVDWKSQRDIYFIQESQLLRQAVDGSIPTVAGNGSYYDKFTSVSAMLYLSAIYESKGLQGLKEELDLGPKGFCDRILSSL